MISGILVWRWRHTTAQSVTAQLRSHRPSEQVREFPLHPVLYPEEIRSGAVKIFPFCLGNQTASQKNHHVADSQTKRGVASVGRRGCRSCGRV